jgi:hypothetical protein
VNISKNTLKTIYGIIFRTVHVNEPYSLANLSKIPNEWICHKNSSEILHHICNSEHTKSNTQDMK